MEKTIKYLETVVNRIEEVVKPKKQLKGEEAKFLQEQLLDIAEKLDIIELEGIKDCFIIESSKHKENISIFLMQHPYHLKKGIMGSINYLQIVLKSKSSTTEEV